MSTPNALQAAIEWAAEYIRDSAPVVHPYLPALLAAACQSRTAPNADLERAAEILRHEAPTGLMPRDRKEMRDLASRLEAMGTAPVDEKLIAAIDDRLAGFLKWAPVHAIDQDLLTRCRTALACVGYPTGTKE